MAFFNILGKRVAGLLKLLVGESVGDVLQQFHGKELLRLGVRKLGAVHNIQGVILLEVK